VIRIKPHYYIHVLDNNSNVTRVEGGPQTFTRQEHEKVIAGPDPMIMIPPRHYSIIANPAVRDDEGKPMFDHAGQVRLRHGDEEIRMEQEPFALWPGEKLYGKVSPLQVVAANTALRLKCIRDFQEHVAGDEWLFQGPGTYVPRIEVQVVEIVRAAVVKPNQALKLRARKETKDQNDNDRLAGEEWLWRKPGAFLPGIDEEIIETVNAYVLTEKKALHLRATRTFNDVFNKQRKAGEEWIVTFENAETHIPDVYEQVVNEEKVVALSNRQYCVVVDPWVEGVQRLGQRELRIGDKSFFLQPGERLEKGIQDIMVLGQEEALLLRARDGFTDEHGEEPVERKAGDRWMVHGPCEFVPPTEIEVLEKRTAIPLDENEGIYVRDMQTGRVRAVSGESYMLKSNEELWEKDLPQQVEELLRKEASQRGEYDSSNGSYERDRTRSIAYAAPHNSAVQIYDYKAKAARTVFGPELIMLGPDEQFSVLSLSGDKPKRPHVIKSLCLLLGPDFMTDIVIVETADHARLSLKLSYNWHFEVEKDDPESVGKLFNVPDFVGDSCKAIASRVRGAVAGETFDTFHKHSARVIRSAVFGVDAEGKVNNKFHFQQNNLVFTNIDIQSVEPVDQRTRDSLQKSVQLAIEITTNSQEAAARHESARIEQEAVGTLERQKIHDEAEAERARRELISLQAESAAVEATGQATAEAKARAEARRIEGEANVKQAELGSQAMKIKSDAELQQKKAAQLAEVEHQTAVVELEVTKSKQLAEIESLKFKEIVTTIGPDTIKAMAEAGPAQQAKLLQGLGLKSFLITDGNSPINLFNTAKGLLGAGPDDE
jgi:major vault protein